MKLIVTKDLSSADPSAILVRDGKDILAYFRGPLSMSAAGAFVYHLKKWQPGKQSMIATAIKHWVEVVN